MPTLSPGIDGRDAGIEDMRALRLHRIVDVTSGVCVCVRLRRTSARLVGAASTCCGGVKYLA